MKFKRVKALAATAVLGTLMHGGIPTLANADTQYRGRVCIESANGYCPLIGYYVDSCAVARLSPEGAPGNTDTRMSVFWSTYAQNFRSEGQPLIGGAYQDVSFSWIGNSGGTAADSRTKIRIPFIQPVNYSQPWLHAVIDIFRYDDFGPGSGSESLCSLRARFVGMKHPASVNASAPASALEPLESLGNSDAGALGNDN